MNNKNIRKAKNFDELLDLKYGIILKKKAQNFVKNEILKEAIQIK